MLAFSAICTSSRKGYSSIVWPCFTSGLGLALRVVGLAPRVAPLEVDELALVRPLLAAGVLVDARRPQLHAEHGRGLQVTRVPCCRRGSGAVILGTVLRSGFRINELREGNVLYAVSEISL